MAECESDLDLVLLDLQLPDADGLEVLETLRRNHPSTAVVVLSGAGTADTMRRALQRGAQGFIPKTASSEVMLSALRLIFSGGIYVPPEFVLGTPPSQESTASPASLGLTERQQQVLKLMLEGKSNKLICRELHLAEPTVKNHMTAILRALNVTSRAQAIVEVSRLGWKL